MTQPDERPRQAICKNRRARRDYFIEDTFEAGLVLLGTEVKSLRQGKANLSDAYVRPRNAELFLVKAHIAAYDPARDNHEPERERKLLMSRREIVKLGVKSQTVRRVVAMVDHSEYKRRQAPIGIKITQRALGKDRRMPITNRYVKH